MATQKQSFVGPMPQTEDPRKQLQKKLPKNQVFQQATQPRSSPGTYTPEYTAPTGETYKVTDGKVQQISSSGTSTSRKKSTKKTPVLVGPTQKKEPERPQTLQRLQQEQTQKQRLGLQTPQLERINYETRFDNKQTEQFYSPQIGQTGYTPGRTTITDKEIMYTYGKEQARREEEAAEKISNIRNNREDTNVYLQKASNIQKMMYLTNPVFTPKPLDMTKPLNIMNMFDKAKSPEIEQSQRVGEIVKDATQTKGIRIEQPLPTNLQKEVNIFNQKQKEYEQDLTRFSDEVSAKTAPQYLTQIDPQTLKVTPATKELSKKEQEKVYLERESEALITGKKTQEDYFSEKAFDTVKTVTQSEQGRGIKTKNEIITGALGWLSPLKKEVKTGMDDFEQVSDYAINKLLTGSESNVKQIQQEKIQLESEKQKLDQQQQELGGVEALNYYGDKINDLDKQQKQIMKEYSAGEGYITIEGADKIDNLWAQFEEGLKKRGVKDIDKFYEVLPEYVDSVDKFNQRAQYLQEDYNTYKEEYEKPLLSIQKQKELSEQMKYVDPLIKRRDTYSQRQETTDSRLNSIIYGGAKIGIGLADATVGKPTAFLTNINKSVETGKPTELFLSSEDAYRKGFWERLDTRAIEGALTIGAVGTAVAAPKTIIGEVLRKGTPDAIRRTGQAAIASTTSRELGEIGIEQYYKKYQPEERNVFQELKIGEADMLMRTSLRGEASALQDQKVLGLINKKWLAEDVPGGRWLWGEEEAFKQTAKKELKEKYGYTTEEAEQAVKQLQAQRQITSGSQVIGLLAGETLSEIAGTKRFLSIAKKTSDGATVSRAFLDPFRATAPVGLAEAPVMSAITTSTQYEDLDASSLPTYAYAGAAAAGTVSGIINLGASGRLTKSPKVSKFIGKTVERGSYIIDPYEYGGDVISKIVAPKLTKQASQIRLPAGRGVARTIGRTSDSKPTAETFEPIQDVNKFMKQQSNILSRQDASTKIQIPDTKTQLQTFSRITSLTETPVTTQPLIPTQTQTQTQTQVQVPTQTQTQTQVTTHTFDEPGLFPPLFGRVGMGSGYGTGTGDWVTSSLTDNKIADYAGDWFRRQQQKVPTPTLGAGTMPSMQGFMNNFKTNIPQASLGAGTSGFMDTLKMPTRQSTQPKQTTPKGLIQKMATEDRINKMTNTKGKGLSNALKKVGGNFLKAIK